MVRVIVAVVVGLMLFVGLAWGLTVWANLVIDRIAGRDTYGLEDDE